MPGEQTVFQFYFPLKGEKGLIIDQWEQNITNITEAQRKLRTKNGGHNCNNM